MKMFKLIQAGTLLLSLAACGGGDGGGSDVASKTGVSPEGIYSGFFTSDALNRTYEVTGVVTGSGEGHFVNRVTGEQIVVRLGVDGTRAEGSLGLYQPTDPLALGVLRTSGSISGDVVARDSISGSYTDATGDSGSFSLTYDRVLYESGARLKQVSGVWGSSEDGYSMSVTIASDGLLFGSDSKGCAYEGAVTIPDARFNVYRTPVKVTCRSGSYDAAGWIVRHPAQGNPPSEVEQFEHIEFGFANDTRAYYNRLTKASAPVSAPSN